MSDNASKLRLFFAVPVACRLWPVVEEVQVRLKAAGAKVKWVERQNLHFTVKFLGSKPRDEVARLIQVVDQVAAAHRPHVLHLQGVGAFPNPRRPRVVWIGCQAGAEQLAALAGDVEQALVEAKLAVPERRPFRPHLTIGRVKAPQGLDRLAPLLEAEAQTVIGSMECDHLLLMQSDLTPQGPVYTAVHRFELTG